MTARLHILWDPKGTISILSGEDVRKIPAPVSAVSWFLAYERDAKPATALLANLLPQPADDRYRLATAQSGRGEKPRGANGSAQGPRDCVIPFVSFWQCAPKARITCGGGIH